MRRKLSFKPKQKQTLSATQKLLLGGLAAGLIAVCSVLVVQQYTPPECEGPSGSEALVPFPCDGTLYLFQRSPSVFYSYEADGSLLEFGNARNCPDGKNSLRLNGIGFRESDGYIYGIEKNSANRITLYRIGAEGRVQTYATIDAPPGQEFVNYVGEIGQDIYYIPGKNKGNKGTVLELSLADVDAALAAGSPMPLPHERATTQKISSIHDWAFNPLDGKLYTLKQNSGAIMVIDVSTEPGTVTTHAGVGSKMGPFGAIYFGGDGRMYASQNTNGTKSQIFTVNYDCPGDSCGELSLISSSPKVSQNDGTSCTAALPSLQKYLAPRYALPGDTVTYTFVYSNTAPYDMHIHSFQNALPAGLGGSYLEGSLKNVPEGAGISSYGGQQILGLSDLYVPGRSGNQVGQLSFQIRVVIPSDPNLYGQTFRSQATFAYRSSQYRSSDKYLPPGSPTELHIVEPFLLQKEQIDGTPVPGSELTYRVTLTNSDNGGNYDGFYRVILRDSIEHGSFVVPQEVQVSSSNPDFAHGTIQLDEQVLLIDGLKLMQGDEVQVVYKVQIHSDMEPGDVIHNYVSARVPQTGVQLAQTMNQGVFPVEFLYFEVEARAGGAHLSWATARELNNLGFEVQHSTDRNTFEDMEFIPGAGTTETSQTYRYQTLPLEAGRHVFRLKQIDLDGQFSYSSLVELRQDGSPDGESHVRFFPNPFQGQGTVEVLLSQEDVVEISALDLAGRQVRLLHTGKLTPSVPHRFPFDAQGLKPGYYVIQVKGNTFLKSKKVLLKP